MPHGAELALSGIPEHSTNEIKQPQGLHGTRAQAIRHSQLTRRLTAHILTKPLPFRQEGIWATLLLCLAREQRGMSSPLSEH